MTLTPPIEHPRVWVDDRHPIFRRGVVSCLLDDGLVVAGESAGLDPVPDAADIDVLVFGVEASTADSVLSWARHTTRLVALAPASGADDLVCRIVELGVSAVLSRAELSSERLTGSVRAAHDGTSTMPSELLPRLLERAATGGASSARGLSAREVSVLRLLSQGEDTREVGDILGYSERTVKNIVRDALMKLNCRNRVHAVAEAVRQGLL